MTKKPLTLEDFTYIYSRVPRVNVELCFVEDGKILLTKRAIEPCLGQWHIPGGTIYFGETVEDAVYRVAKEECGVEVSITGYVGNILYPKMHGAGYFGWSIGLAYKVEIVSGKPMADDEADGIDWFSELPENIIDDQRQFIESASLLD